VIRKGNALHFPLFIYSAEREHITEIILNIYRFGICRIMTENIDKCMLIIYNINIFDELPMEVTECLQLIFQGIKNVSSLFGSIAGIPLRYAVTTVHCSAVKISE
jgi:hypothetical protein